MNKTAKISKNQRVKIWACGLAFLGCVTYVIWPFIVGAGQMSSFCKMLALGIGTTQSAVQRLAEEKGYKLHVNGQGVGVISDPRSMGRFICQIQFAQGQLISANYYYND